MKEIPRFREGGVERGISGREHFTKYSAIDRANSLLKCTRRVM